jgi:hypothetical protein
LTNPANQVTPDEIRSITAAATPHFSQQVRERVSNLIADLPSDHPARVMGEQEIERLAAIGKSGEVRGTPNEPTLEPLDSVTKED